MSAPGGKLVLQPNPNIAVQDLSLIHILKRILTTIAALVAALTLSAAEYGGKWIGCDYEGDVLQGNLSLIHI